MEIEAFKLAVDSVNNDSSLLRDATITGLVETAESEDGFANMEKGTFSSEDNLILVCSKVRSPYNVDRPRRENVS